MTQADDMYKSVRDSYPPSYTTRFILIMSSYVITGAARGIGVGGLCYESLRQLAEIHHKV